MFLKNPSLIIENWNSQKASEFYLQFDGSTSRAESVIRRGFDHEPAGWFTHNVITSTSVSIK